MRIRRCPACGGYTLKTSCSACGIPTSNARPARFSPEDRYGAYRRRMKKVMGDGEDQKARP